MISIVIPTYNNTRQLIENIKKNKTYFDRNEVIVINDFPGKSIVKHINEFPYVKLLENSSNLGFAGSVNHAILKTSHAYVMLLNDDVLLTDTSYLKAITTLQSNSKLFAVSFAQRQKNGLVIGKNRLYWKSGFLRHAKAWDMKPGINGWAEGGSCIIDKEKYLKLGGFDPMYSPFYWEDVDLSYRAWKQGYTIFFDPTIVVNHQHESTIGKQFNREMIDTISYRNQFIFIWKNVTDFNLLASHLLCILITLPRMLITNTKYVKGLIQALQKLPKLINKKNKDVLSDKEILSKFK